MGSLGAFKSETLNPKKVFCAMACQQEPQYPLSKEHIRVSPGTLNPKPQTLNHTLRNVLYNLGVLESLGNDLHFGVPEPLTEVNLKQSPIMGTIEMVSFKLQKPTWLLRCERAMIAVREKTKPSSCHLVLSSENPDQEGAHLMQDPFEP